MSLNWDVVSGHAGPEESPGFLLWRAGLAWRRAIELALAPVGLTQPQFVVLANIGWLTRNGDLVRQVEVGRRCGIDPNTMSQILRGLERRKLVSRHAPVHEQSKYPRLTASGRAVVAKAVEAVEAVDVRFFGALGADIGVAMQIFGRLASAAAALGTS